MEKNVKRKKLRKLNKYEIAAIVIVAALVIAFAIYLPFYLKSKQSDVELYNQGQIAFYVDGVETAKKDLNDIKALVGVKEFQAVYKRNGQPAETRTYKGFLIKDIFTALGIDFSTKTGIEFVCKDITINKNIDFIDDYTYIAFESNGKAIPDVSPTGDEDGGPYVVIPSKDTVSQNRVRWLVSIKLR